MKFFYKIFLEFLAQLLYNYIFKIKISYYKFYYILIQKEEWGLNLAKKKKKNSNITKGQAKDRKKENDAKIKEREKRIKEKNKEKSNDEFEVETEKLIQMTNKNRIEKEEKRKKQNTMKVKKKQKRAKKIILKIFLFVALIGGAIVFAITSPLFNIKEIKVLNNSQVSSDTIISLAELKLDENIFKFYKGEVTRKIKENAYIESVSIERKIPSIVEIQVEERVPKYSVDYMGRYVYINSQGYLLENSEDNKGLPVIHGVTTNEEEITPGNRLNNEDLNRLEDVMKVMSSANENGLEGKITSIDIGNKNDYTIYLEESKKKVHLGNTSNLSNKMLYILAIMEQEEGKEGDIFVNGDLNNKFQPFFREKV